MVVDVRLDGVAPIATDQDCLLRRLSYYRAIAELGYAGVGRRRDPLHPLVPPVGTNGTGILLLASISALLAAAVVHRLVVEVLGDGDLARRSATLVSLAPPAFTLVWAYAEWARSCCCPRPSCRSHRRRWWPASPWAARRPHPYVRLLLVVPAAVEARGGRRSAGAGRGGYCAVAVLALVAGLAAFLLWVEEATGDRAGAAAGPGRLPPRLRVPAAAAARGSPQPG